jgi:hypothetical protein
LRHLLVLVCATSCVGARSAGSPRSTSEVQQVPAKAPTKHPDALFDSLGTVMSPTGHGSPWVRSIVGVAFKASASQKDRQAAVESIGGVVVGGYRLEADDGEYFVRIRGAEFADLVAALDALRRLPQVDFAAPVIENALSGGRSTRPPSRVAP